jgi:hypothetical protein
MVQVMTFAANSRSAADAARNVAQQAQTWLEREQGTDVRDTTGIIGLDGQPQMPRQFVHGCLTKQKT